MLGAFAAGLFLIPAYYIAKAKGYNLAAFPLVTIGLFSAGIPILIDVTDHPDVDITHPVPIWVMTLPALVWFIVWLLPAKEDAPGEEYLGITFTCPECEEEVTFPRSSEGLTAQCPACGETINVPMDEFSPEPSVPERIKPDIPSGPVCYACFADEMSALQMQTLFEDNGIRTEVIGGIGGGALSTLSGAEGFRVAIDIADWDRAVQVEKASGQPYLYIFNDPEAKFILASGIQFKVLANQIADRGLLLLRHAYPYALLDDDSGFNYLPSEGVEEMAKENIYEWGGFCWIDFIGTPPFPLGKNGISELLYFAHTAEPLNKSFFDALGNKFLCYIFDDGWYLKLYYRNWSDVEGLLKDVVPGLGENENIIKDIETGDGAFWIANGISERCDKTTDIDRILIEKLGLPTSTETLR